MENLQHAAARNTLPGTGPFGPIRLYRQLRLFKSALLESADIGTSFVPEPDFLIRLVTDYRGHQHMVRAVTGPYYRDFDNFIRGRHHTAPHIRRLISAQTGIPEQTLTELVHGQSEGPLLPFILDAFAWIERIPQLLVTLFVAEPVPCKCCGANLLDDQDHFWSEQPFRLHPDEYRFVDRLLNMLVGIGAIVIFCSSESAEDEPFNWDGLVRLSSPGRHPIGNWLAGVQHVLKLGKLIELAEWMQLSRNRPLDVPYGRLKKWSAGEDLMPMSVMRALAQAAKNRGHLLLTAHLARGIAFVVDVVVASVPGEAPTRKAAQECVDARLNRLIENVQIALKHRMNRNPPPKLPPA